jgi:DNA repair exonuclease SbcCD nuclease subunit
MKICLLGDTHFGVRNDSKIFHKYMENFYTEVFFPALKERGVDQIIQLGDLFDRRKYINFYTLEQSKRYFFDVIEREGYVMYSLLGNHDIFWREKLDVNSPTLLLEAYKNIHIIQEPVVLDNADVIPWLCKDNEKQIHEFIDKSNRPYCFGHFELKGFEMSKGIENHEGMDPSVLAKYKQVFSGHFHTKSNKGNIMYLGTPYELFWNDYKDPKGFYIWDTVTNDLEFIQNNDPMFVKLYYDDSSGKVEFDSNVTDKYVKLVVVTKKNFSQFDSVVDSLYNNNPAEVKIIEDMSDFENQVDDDSINIEDTMSLLSEYVDAIETDADKSRLKNILKELYIEAHDYAEEK